MNEGNRSADQSAAPKFERCHTHKHPCDTWTDCRACGGDGETYSEPDYEGDWAAGYHRCYSCGGSGGYYECLLCLEEGDDY